jgi:hypothetical protein
MLTDPSPQDDHSRLLRPDAQVVQPPDIAYDVDDEPRVLVRVEIDHVAQGAVGQGGAEDRDVVLPRGARQYEKDRGVVNVWTKSNELTL